MTTTKTNWIRAGLVVAFVIVLLMSMHAYRARGAEPSVQPYGMISWTGINGEAELGAGLDASWAITKNLSVMGYGEADNTYGTLVERFGGGLRYSAYLGKHFSLDGGIAPSYDIDGDRFFARLPIGAELYLVRGKNVDLSLRLQYAFDVSGNGPNGSSKGRALFGPRLGFKF